MLKYFLFPLLLVTISLSLKATDAEPTPLPVYSIIRELHEPQWYRDQANAWQAVLDKDPRNADGWLYLYRCGRNLRILGEKDNPINTTDVVAQMEKNIPETFQYYLIRHITNEQMFTDDTWLRKAVAAGPNRWEIYPELMVWYAVHYDGNSLSETACKWLASAQISEGILEWNYNSIIGLPERAILITFGDNDTIPGLALQYGKEVRKDVTILNYSLCSLGEYRLNTLQKAGIADPAEGEDINNPREVLNKILQTSTRPIYFMMGAPEDLIDSLKSNLFITGVNYRYSATPYDNMSELVRNYESLWLKDQLREGTFSDISESVLSCINYNYIASLAMLFEWYDKAGNATRATEVKEMAYNIARRYNKMEEVEGYFKPSKPMPGKSMISFSMKSFSKSLKKVSAKLYTAEAEVSNAEYGLFLEDLLKRKAFDKLNIARNAEADWKKYLPADKQNLTVAEYFSFGPFDGPKFPVYGISYEAAVMYCDWLTEIYNNSTDKHKAFRKVKFRLPTVAEWEQAARANDKSSVYPWKGDQPRNAKGCYLANFNVNDLGACKDCPNNKGSVDGGYLTVPVTSYFPNDLGLYNTVGNVAEMTAEKGVAKGGSWYHKPDECKIGNTQNYKEAVPYIGFRIFMDVIEK